MEDEQNIIERQRVQEQWFNLQKQKFDSFVQRRKRQKFLSTTLDKCHFENCYCTESKNEEADIKICNTCKCVAYCGIEHESRDIKRHAGMGCRFAQNQYFLRIKQSVAEWLRNISMVELDVNTKALLSSQPLFSSSQLSQFRSCVPFIGNQLQLAWTSNRSRCALLVYCFLASDTICIQVARLRNFLFPINRRPIIEVCDVTALGVPAFVLTTGLNLFSAPPSVSVCDLSPPECYKMSEVVEEDTNSVWSLLFSAFLCSFIP